MRRLRITILGMALALPVGACGGAGVDMTTLSTDTTHDHDTGHNMGDPNAAPADEIAGATTTSGVFTGLDPGADDSITGEAIMARHEGGTTVTIVLEGLRADTDYISHVHQADCSEAGGPHYKFDPEGDHHPPNEIHLAFTSDGSGHGSITAENHQVASEEAVSVVIHVAGPDSPKIACADLKS